MVPLQLYTPQIQNDAKQTAAATAAAATTTAATTAAATTAISTTYFGFLGYQGLVRPFTCHGVA